MAMRSRLPGSAAGAEAPAKAPALAITSTTRNALIAPFSILFPA